MDASGNVYTTGFFHGTVDFDPGAGVFNLSAAGSGANAFVLKLDAGGNFVWAIHFGGSSSSEIVSESIAVDALGKYPSA